MGRDVKEEEREKLGRDVREEVWRKTGERCKGRGMEKKWGEM